MIPLALYSWGEVNTWIVGDITGDRVVDVDDVSTVINIILDSNQYNDVSGNPDVTGDDIVDVDDLNKIINIILKIEPKEIVYQINGVSFTMVEVNGGTFMMGATEEQLPYADDNEKPAHEVTVSDFKIANTPVTQELWMAVMGNNPSHYNGVHGNYDYGVDLKRPVECLTWADVQNFLNELNQLTGAGFRVPTEAEWEFAARGGKKSHGYIYSGSNDFDEVGWDLANTYYTQPVAGKKPNELGLYDMSGNVWEWCNDWWDENYYSVSPSFNPQGPDTGVYKVTRGGSIVNISIASRVSFRDWAELDVRYTTMGMRLAQ